MSPRWICATLAAACLIGSSEAAAQTAVGRESAAGRYNRLRDFTLRPHQGVIPVSPDVFGTAAISAGVTYYDTRFRRVASTDGTHPLVQKIAAGLTGLTPLQQLQAVHSQVRAKVNWAHDLDTMKVADLWANAGETLERGAGDSEDIAIVQMQILKAAGWNPRDLYISIGRDKSVGAHIILLARTPGGSFYVLDDRAGEPLTPQQHARFTPVLTLGEGKSWVHGRRVGGSGRLSAR